MLYDTHAHLNMKAFDEDREHVAAQAIEQYIIFNNVGTHKDTSRRAVELADGKNIFAVVGLHPVHTLTQDLEEEDAHFTSREEIFDYDFYKKLASDPKVVGIGECGLDYFRLPPNYSFEEVKKIQAAAFREQIKLSKELGKALVIHCRTEKESNVAYDDVLSILEEFAPLNFEIHSFTGDWQLAERFLKLGGYLGLNGIVTFDKTGKLKEVIENVPLDKILIETDAPFLSPPPHRGKRNLPQYVEHVARYIADTKGVSFEDIATQTTANAKKLFKVL
jgi:TatD DNase family protein